MIEEEGRQSGGTFLGCSIPVDSALEEQGWQWRCNVDRAKLAEVVGLYEDLGFDVRVQPVRVDCLSVACNACQGELAVSKAVYVRAKS